MSADITSPRRLPARPQEIVPSTIRPYRLTSTDIPAHSKTLRTAETSISSDLANAPADDTTPPNEAPSRSGDLDGDSSCSSADIGSPRRLVARRQEIVRLKIRRYRVTSTTVAAVQKTVRLEEGSRSGDLADCSRGRTMTPREAPSRSGGLDRVRSEGPSISGRHAGS